MELKNRREEEIESLPQTLISLSLYLYNPMLLTLDNSNYEF